MSAWDRVHFQLEEVAGAGNLVFAYMHTVAKGKNTGKTRAFPGVEVFRFRDGQVVEFRPFYFDTARAKAVAGD
ncbi:nuclear transport factor 2 family protein [[Kitasatospora] papulosa]|uniref:nuclear transport factor 2 family protein n=1 Tax=[Kitasatospora] papulosa TaxID=1464011 RepID=UPI00367F10EB